MTYETLYQDRWTEIRRTPDGYTYLHCRHGDGVGVAVLVYNPDTKLVLGRFETTPCHQDKPKLCSITGGVEKGDVIATVLNELREEAGIVTTKDKLEWLGEVWPSKASDTVMHLYALAWTGPVNHNPEGDGSAGEKGATVDWIPWQNAALSQDPLLSTMLARMMVIKTHEFI